MQIDRATPFGARVVDHLSTETIAWLTTVGKDGPPAPNRCGTKHNFPPRFPHLARRERPNRGGCVGYTSPPPTQ